MRREGRVIATDKGNATVLLMKHSACGDCGACHIGEENMNMKIEALNSASAGIGDKVMVDMGTPNVLTAAFIAYGIPLIMLIIGIAGGNSILTLLGVTKGIELYSLFIGAILLALTYIIIRKKDDKFKESKKYLSEITEIVE
ncbi:SoxR reducing system RseC family protein [Wukongibacter baidiensis]|uniref:SoxR reducing system RseC family protein n=1 Tax=Wukongibacter baidiensis TaxID=1723361 RepID=UPI003D7FFCA8